MKKMLLASALAAYYEMCSTDAFAYSKQTGSSSTKTITHRYRFWKLGGKKTVDAAKICGAENVVKTETQQTFVNGCSGFVN